MPIAGPFVGQCAYRMRMHVLFVFLATFACVSSLSAQQNSLAREKRAAIEKAVSSFMSRDSIPGLSAAVVLDGEPRWAQGFVMADLENYSPATSSALLRLGSVSELMFATVVLQML